MLRAIVLALTVASASAFVVPHAATAPKTIAAAFDASKQLGAQAPLGFFDPLGLHADGDEERFNYYRKVETKHGRVAMMAILGT